MIIQRPKGTTRVVGKSQGYLGLPMRDEVALDSATGELTPSMVTAWEPTPDELRKITEGQPIMLRILGNVPPPVYVYVGDDFESEGAPETAPQA